MEMKKRIFKWGPFVYNGMMSPEDLKLLNKLCIKNKKLDARKTLAATIKQEYFINLKKFHEITLKYYKDFIIDFSKYYNTGVTNLNLESAWVNFMKAGECNPPHIHTGCNLSSVWFVKVPEKLRKEHAKYQGTIKDGGPGAISFMHGSHSQFCIDEQRVFPEEGMFFIFPFNLKHYVTPFLSKVERVSVAANYTINVTSKAKHSGFFGFYEKNKI